MVEFRDKMAAVLIKKADVWGHNSFQLRESWDQNVERWSDREH